MAVVNPAPRRRIRPVASAPASPPPRVRPTHGHDLYEPFDGLELPSPVESNGQRSQPQHPLNERVTSVHNADPAEAEAMVLQTLHQFVLARTPPDVIARNMGMSFRSLREWKRKLHDKLKAEAKAKEPFDFIASMIAETEEIKGQAWREVAAAPPKEWTRRMRAIDTIMKANAEQMRLLQIAGMFDNQPMRQPLPPSDDEDGGANILKQMTANFMSGGYAANANMRMSPRPGDVIVED